MRLKIYLFAILYVSRIMKKFIYSSNFLYYIKKIKLIFLPEVSINNNCNYTKNFNN